MKGATEQKEAVRELQSYLRRISYSEEGENIERVPIDGIFGRSTEEAVKRAQERYGLAQTGVVDEQTWSLIYADYLDVVEREQSTCVPDLFLSYPAKYKVGKGETHAMVGVIQLMLRELSISYDGFEQVNVSGTYDDSTSDAVKRLQAAALLPITGEVDLMTWKRLRRDFFFLVARGA